MNTEIWLTVDPVKVPCNARYAKTLPESYHKPPQTKFETMVRLFHNTIMVRRPPHIQIRPHTRSTTEVKILVCNLLQSLPRLWSGSPLTILLLYEP